MDIVSENTRFPNMKNHPKFDDIIPKNGTQALRRCHTGPNCPAHVKFTSTRQPRYYPRASSTFPRAHAKKRHPQKKCESFYWASLYYAYRYPLKSTRRVRIPYSYGVIAWAGSRFGCYWGMWGVRYPYRAGAPNRPVVHI